MLKIRLQRTGRKNRPAYRVVVCEHTSPVKGKFIERVGHYNPLDKECVLNVERIDYWKSVGAQASDTVQSLLDKDGKVEQTQRTRMGKRKKEKEAALKAEEAAKKAAAEEAKKAAKDAEKTAKEAPVETDKKEEEK